MAKTLLNGVNEVLKRVSIIQGDSGLLTNLTDSARQVYIDIAIQVWNESVDDLYDLCDEAKPNELAESTITLVEGDRDYALASDLVQLHYPLVDETNGQYITEYPGGYHQIIKDQPIPTDFVGLPLRATIRPTDGELYLDWIPAADDDGLVYKYRYDKDLVLSLATDTFPFSDAAFRAMVPAVAEMWKLERTDEFVQGVYDRSMARASRFITKKQTNDSWLPLATTPLH